MIYYIIDFLDRRNQVIIWAVLPITRRDAQRSRWSLGLRHIAFGDVAYAGNVRQHARIIKNLAILGSVKNNFIGKGL
jgi:hypothetical protein